MVDTVSILSIVLSILGHNIAPHQKGYRQCSRARHTNHVQIHLYERMIFLHTWLAQWLKIKINQIRHPDGPNSGYFPRARFS